MRSQASSKALLGALSALLWLFLGVAAQAVPIAHTITSASSISADVDLAGTATLKTSLGNVSRSFSLSGNVAASPTGDIQVDWGAPGWNDALAIPTGGVDVHASNLGSLSDTVQGIDLFGLLSVNIGIKWTLDSVDLSGGNFLAPTVPSDGTTPGTGPWLAFGPLTTQFGIGSTLDVSALGIDFPGIPMDIPNLTSGPLSLPLNLSRIGGVPGTGTQTGFSVTVPGSFPLSLGTQQEMFRGCEVPIPVFGGCALDVQSLDLNFSTATLTNLSLDVVATSNTAIVPEPGSALLVGLGLASLLVRRRARG